MGAEILLDDIERRQGILHRPEGLSRLPAQRIVQLDQSWKPVLDPDRVIPLVLCLGIDLAAQQPSPWHHCR